MTFPTTCEVPVSDILKTNFVRIQSSYNPHPVEIEITAEQRSEPTPGPSGLYVVWDVCRGIAEVNPVLRRVGHVARHQFVVIFDGRVSGGTSDRWYVMEASDVKNNTRYLMGTGISAQTAFDNFCERAAFLLSSDPDDVAIVSGYGDQADIENMREQARRCFMPGS
jgi:hypothetical protein